MRRLTEAYRSPGSVRSLALASGAALLIAGWRLLLPAPELELTGAQLVFDHLFSLVLVLVLLLSAWGVGAEVLDRLRGRASLEPLLSDILAIGLGLGCLSFAVFLTGVLQVFRPVILAALLLAVFVLTAPKWHSLLKGTIDRLPEEVQGLRKQSPLVKLSLAAVAVTAIMATLQALTPPWTFDALMYHLEAPAIYLEQGRLILMPELWQANGPLAIEMLYALGLAFGTPSFAQLTHLLLTLLLVLVTYAFGRRWLSRQHGYLAVLLLAGIPIFPIWGSIANIDSGWALFEFAGVASLICWADSGERGWARIAGALLGLALATKYVALTALLPAALIILLALRRMPFARWRGDLFHFALPLAILGGPWYLLNLFRAGNPVYPFVFGGPGWDEVRLDFLTSYLSGFGGGDRLRSFLLAPVWLYTRRELYTTFMSGIELPSLLFPLALLIPLARPSRPIHWLALATLARLVGWGLTTQQTRFLLPLFPALAVLAATVLIALGDRLPLNFFFTTLGKGLVGGFVLTAMLYQFVFWLLIQPGGVLVGAESRHDFLVRNSAVFAAQDFVQHELPSNARVLMLWDSQTFYCDQRCIGDAEQSIWTQVVSEHRTVEDVAAALKSRGYTHLLGSLDSLNFFLRHDPTGLHTQAAEFYLDTFRPACTQPLYGDDNAVVDAVTCD